jgi:DNA-binding response OmpR family regulator
MIGQERSATLRARLSKQAGFAGFPRPVPEPLTVLVVDDDEDFLEVIAYALRRTGMRVLVEGDGPAALRRWEVDHPSVVVLDVGLPQISGFEVCRHIRQASATPVILLTGLVDEEDVERGFAGGADDYVTKPCSPAQLALRIEAVWRRAQPQSIPPWTLEPRHTVEVGEFVLDADAHEVYAPGRRIRLTPIEFRLLYLLAINAGRVVHAEQLVEYAWECQSSDVCLLKTHLSHLRRKLRLTRRDLSVVPRVGYRLNRVPLALAS